MSLFTTTANAITDADRSIMAAVNAHAWAAPQFDHWVVPITALPLIKLIPLVVMLWWLWASRNPHTQSKVWVTALGAIAAFGLARLAAHTLPYRLRPLHDPAVAFHLPDGMDANALQLWSASPSDHPAILGALCGGLFLIRPAIGVLAGGYGILFVLLPRLYTGLHFPSALLAGFVLGIAAALAVHRPMVLAGVSQITTRWARAHLPSFVAFAFAGSHLLATNGDDLRRVLGLLKGLL